MSKEALPYLHPTVGDLYIKQRTMIMRIVRLMFAFAGCMWIIKYIPQLLPYNEVTFTKNQYQLYLILLTLWGYDYRRELERMKVILRLAGEKGIAPENLTAKDIEEAKELHRFDILHKHRRDGKWFAVFFTWLLLILALGQLLRQGILLIWGSGQG